MSIGVLTSAAAFDARRYLRNPVLVYVALAAPIAAYFMVPDADAAYAVLTVNGEKPVLTAPVLGLELGVLTATLLTPLAFIFLRAGPTRSRPWQITDVAPHGRALATLGRWGADTMALWLLLAALTAAGLILGLFRLDGPINIGQTIAALWLPAAPSLALIAAIRLFLGARPMTRGWFGDVVFFILWIALLLTGIIGTSDPQTGQMTANPLADAFGFTAPIIGAVDYPVTEVTIGGAANPGTAVRIEAWASVSAPDYVAARGVWLGLAAAVAIVAGLIWAPMKTRQPKARTEGPAVAREEMSAIVFRAPHALNPQSPDYLGVITGEIGHMLKAKAWIAILAAAAIAGAALPFRTMAGPAILLSLIFPLTQASARWQNTTLDTLLGTLGPGRVQRALCLFCASSIIALVVMSPALARMVYTQNLDWLTHALFIIFAVPALIIVMGMITRSAVTGRLLMLLAWYTYLSST
ncbi:MAG: hypothetical protein AAGH42_03785 [Pseudomonadota bacterium]